MLMRFSMLAAAAAAAMCLTGEAQAADLPKDGLTVKEVQAWLDKEGFKATVKGEGGDAVLSSESPDGVKFEIHFYDCVKDRCASMAFAGGFDLKDAMTPAKANEWNEAKRYVKCFLDEEGDPWFTYDVNLSPGGTQEALDEEFALWLSFLPDIVEFIGW
jgi:hypothetical protein